MADKADILTLNAFYFKNRLVRSIIYFGKHFYSTKFKKKYKHGFLALQILLELVR